MKPVATVLEKVGAYARLLRLSNAPTAVADVWMGYAVVMGSLEPTVALFLASIASLCFYHGGMVLNDVYDAEQDKIDNRGRPIQEGLVDHVTALRCSFALLCYGICTALFANLRLGPALGVGLAVAVFAYNSRLKKTVAGPFLMAICRYLNILLGVVAGESTGQIAFGDRSEFAFSGVVPYVIGLTAFAKVEAVGGKRVVLLGATAISCTGILAYVLLPYFYLGIPGNTVPKVVGTSQWLLFWGVTAAFALRGMVAAIIQPTPRNIGRGVGIAIQGIIVIDATLAALYAGPVAGLAIFALLPVTMLLSRWIPQT